MSTKNVERMDDWIRKDFKQINTALEELYFAQEDPSQVGGVGNAYKEQLLNEGNCRVSALLREGNTDEGFDNGFDLLGNVGLFMAACRRHELTNPANEKRSPLVDASALAMQLGASLGVTPRFASAHLETHNMAKNGFYKTFTNLPDEQRFIDYNTRGVFAFIRASEALLHALPLGISHPITYDLLMVAKQALEDVVENNQQLFDELDVARFFHSVRPYYKPYRVGLHEYRGANAGDFAGINVIDLLLGLCRADDPYYSQLLVDKFLFMRPDDQLTLRDCMRRKSLMDCFLKSLSKGEEQSGWYQKNLAVFVQVCEAHGQTAIQHHELLIRRFIEAPAATSNATEKEDLTASGPPLPVLLKGLKKLCDLRSAADVEGIPTRFGDLTRLRESLVRV
ncbi:DUF1864 family protein [Alteromonadaceae bacterium M269]|nr:DUF1864 family protein [Alteromonadaceae bacterium M269]